jgi:8-oxo-dGTP diphosphatase
VESNEEVLVREVKEELSVNILPDSIKFYGSFEAQAHGKPLGTIVRITCYFADFSGLLKPSNEIEEIGWLTSKDIGTERTSQVDYLLLKRLFKDELID